MVPLENTVQEYAWGSRTFIPELLGADRAAERPQAELWIGAHPGAPSWIRVDGVRERLDTVIQRDPPAILGRRVADRFGGRLPFLMKVLAAASPLSIQAHPDSAQAVRGFARDNAAGLTPDSPERSYRDAFHKPEIMAPLTDLWALHGFRAPPEAADLMRRSGVPGLRTLTVLLERSGSLELLKAIFALDTDTRGELGRALARAADRLGEPVGGWITRLSSSYPGDAGVLAPLFLNLVRVPPGRALYLGPGELHAYLEGAGIELMAASDNVLRGGLTPKKVDVAELLSILDPTARPTAPLAPRILPTGEEVFETPAAEFRLSRVNLAAGKVFARPPRDALSPEIHLVTRGSASLRTTDGHGLDLARGQSCLIPAGVEGWTLQGDGVVHRARVP